MTRRRPRRIVRHRRLFVRRAAAAAAAPAPAAASGGGGGGGGGEELEAEPSDEGGEEVSGEMFGALERRNPLPAGRYWIDATSAKAPELEGYFASNASRIHVEVTEGAGETEGTVFYIFTVREPVAWFAGNFGFPTVATADIKSKADTVSRPDLPKDGADQISDALASLGSGTSVLVVALGVGVGVVVGLKLLEVVRKK